MHVHVTYRTGKQNRNAEDATLAMLAATFEGGTATHGHGVWVDGNITHAEEQTTFDVVTDNNRDTDHNVLMVGEFIARVYNQQAVLVTVTHLAEVFLAEQ